MIELHSEILILLKEIEQICKKHSIRYYMAGGSTIGAVRHKGFIPWDDDADIYMTRENYYKFIKAVNEENLENRKLDSKEVNPEYTATIPRYINTNTTCLLRTNSLNTCEGGLCIDIFIIDPVVGDEIKQEEHIALLNVYSDYINPFFVYSSRNKEEYLELYFKYKEKEKQIGREEVIKELEEKLFTCDEKEATHYILRWGTLPHIFEKEMFGEPVYVEFEDMTLPIPSKWYEYLEMLYGPDWMQAPGIIEESHHVSVIDLKNSTDMYFEDTNKYMDKKIAYKNLYNRKKHILEREKLKRVYEKNFLELLFKYMDNSYKNQMTNVSLKVLFDSKKYKEIIKLFEYYLNTQLSKEISGKPMHVHTLKYYNPVFVPMDSKSLSYLIQALVYDNQLNKAKRLINIYKSNFNSIDAEMKEAERIVILASDILKGYYMPDMDLLKKSIVELGKDIQFTGIYGILISAKAILETNELALEEIYEEANAYHQISSNEYALKAMADIKYKLENYEEANNLYGKLAEKTRNMFFIREIEEKTDIIVNLKNIVKPPKEMTEETLLQLKLIGEIDEICKKNKLEYFLNENTSNYALEHGVLSNNLKQNTIMMTTENAIKLMEILEKQLLANRYFKTSLNSREIIGNSLVYGIKESINMTYPQIMNEDIKEINVKIKILEKDGSLINSKLATFISKLAYIKKYISKRRINNIFIPRSIKILEFMSRSFGDNLNSLAFKLRIKNTLSSKNKSYYIRSFTKLGNTKKINTIKDSNKRISEVILKDYKINILANSQKLGNNNIVNKKNYNLNRIIKNDISYESYMEELGYKSDNNIKNIIQEIREYNYNISIYNKEIGKYWALITRIADKKKLSEELIPMKEEIVRLYESKKYIDIGIILKEYSEKSIFYAKHEMAFNIDNEIFDIYCEVLKKEKKENFRKKILKYYKNEMNNNLFKKIKEQ